MKTRERGVVDKIKNGCRQINEIEISKVLDLILETKICKRILKFKLTSFWFPNIQLTRALKIAFQLHHIVFSFELYFVTKKYNDLLKE